MGFRGERLGFGEWVRGLGVLFYLFLMSRYILHPTPWVVPTCSSCH